MFKSSLAPPSREFLRDVTSSRFLIEPVHSSESDGVLLDEPESQKENGNIPTK